MRTLSFTLAFSLFILGLQGAWAAPKYPFVVETHGRVLWSNKNDDEGKLKPKQVLIEKATLETEAKSTVVVQIDAHRRVTLSPNSRIEMPSISWETGEAPVILLKFGQIRWREEAGKKYNIALRSDLFEFLTPVGDFVFNYDPKKALAEVKAIQGTMEFSAMNAEDVALVTAGQKVSFQGVREGDEIVYDVLLKGKKIPRGKLSAVDAFTADEKKLYSEAEAKKEAAAVRKKEAAEAKAKERVRGADEICEKPFAKLNQCAWTCENNPKNEKKVCRLEQPEVRCVRRRCNANGEWAEAAEVPGEKAKSLCGIQPNVKACDY
ncbi:hypothetical protein [Bdellovibrio sp. HCB337]|uniref:hypothetical protein n=1 Tax=Bdellovibrio sp. HCB337 TaxID=3394358 RepID=UPI0039A47558